MAGLGEALEPLGGHSIPTTPSQTQTNPRQQTPFPTTHMAVLRPLENQFDLGVGIWIFVLL